MLIEYKGVRIDTLRPLTFNEKIILEQIEEETPVRIEYNGKRWFNTNLGIKESIPTVLGDITTIIYNGSRINLSISLMEYFCKLLEQIEKNYGLKFHYININKNDQYIIEYKGARIDLSNSLNEGEKRLLKQMEKDLVDNISKVRDLESRVAEITRIPKTNPDQKYISTIYINGRRYIYEYNQDNRFIEFEGNQIDMSAPLSSSALNLLLRMINEKKIRLDYHTGKLILMVPIFYSQITEQQFTEQSIEDYETSEDVQLDF